MRIRNARPWGGEACDIAIENARISAIVPHDPAAPIAEGDVDGRGRILIPSFSDVHVHRDSSRIGLPFRPHTGGAGVWAMMLNDRESWGNTEVPHAKIVAETLERMIARGTTRVRSYAQVDVDCKLEKYESVVAAKEKFQGRADVQVMVFPQAGILRDTGTVDVLEAALRQGADVMGGIDPCMLDRDPVKHLDIVFGLAEKYQVEVDIHLHEPGDLGVFRTELIIERTRALGMQGKVTMSHAYDLGAVSTATSRRLIDEFAALDIAMATVAPVAPNQLPLAELTAAGVRVGLGEDGQRDYWSPYGDCDLLSRTWQLAFTNRFREDHLIEHCLAVATMGGASIMDHDVPRLAGVADRPGLEVGDRASRVLVDGAAVFATRVVDTPVTPLIFITCVSILVSNWAGPIVNTGDYTRNATSMKAPAIGFPIGVIGSYILFAIVTVSFIGALQVVSGGDIDINRPGVFIQAINQGVGNPFVVVLLILAMNVGAVAFVVFGNMLPAGLQLTAQLQKFFTLKRGAILAAIIGTLIVPWQFVENTDALFLFYSLIGSMFGPIAGIVLASYFIESKKTLDVAGIYADYKGGEKGSLPAYNWRALGVLIASFVLTMIGRLPGINEVDFLAQVNNLAFFSGLIIGFVGYTITVFASRRKA